MAKINFRFSEIVSIKKLILNFVACDEKQFLNLLLLQSYIYVQLNSKTYNPEKK